MPMESAHPSRGQRGTFPPDSVCSARWKTSWIGTATGLPSGLLGMRSRIDAHQHRHTGVAAMAAQRISLSISAESKSWHVPGSMKME